MPNCLQFALSNPVKGKEAEFNVWYGDHHLYAGVRTPGILAGQRFRRAAGPWPSGKHDYMALWEIDNPAYAIEQLALVKGTAEMPISDAADMAGIQPPTMWLRASARNAARISTDTSSRKTSILMLANARQDEDAAFEQTLTNGGLAILADRAGVLCADFLTLAEEQIRNNARKYRYGLLIELYDEAQGLASLEGLLPNLAHLDSQRWLAPVFKPLGERVDSATARLYLAA